MLRKISAIKLNKIINTIDMKPKVVDWHGLQLEVRPIITAKEYMSLVHSIVDDCKAPDEGCAVELVDFAIKANIIATYTNVELPNDLQDLYNVVYASDLYDIVCTVVKQSQIEAIYRAVNLYIEG